VIVTTAVEILTTNRDPALQKESVALLASLSNSSNLKEKRNSIENRRRRRR
jgi:hypothetical protein